MKKYDWDINYPPKHHFFARKIKNLEKDGLKNKCITYASAEGASKNLFNMLIGR